MLYTPFQSTVKYIPADFCMWCTWISCIFPDISCLVNILSKEINFLADKFHIFICESREDILTFLKKLLRIFAENNRVCPV